ncbi:MAG: hypothetical protein AB7N24_06340 [Dehalococcoidia bacterium]
MGIDHGSWYGGGVGVGVAGIGVGVDGASDGGTARVVVGVGVPVGKGEDEVGCAVGGTQDGFPPAALPAGVGMAGRGSAKTWASVSRGGVGVALGSGVSGTAVGLGLGVLPEWANSCVSWAAGVGVSSGRAAPPLELV